VSVLLTRDTFAPDFTAELWTGTGSVPQTKIADFVAGITPGPHGGLETYSFLPSSSTTLLQTGNYFFSIRNNIGTNSSIGMTFFGGNSFTGPGTIFDERASSSDLGTNWSSQSNALVLRVDGTPAAAVPEPSSFLMLGVVGTGVAAVRRKRKQRIAK